MSAVAVTSTIEIRLAQARWRADPTRTLLDDVIGLARVAYAGLTDAAGHPAIEHPLRVMARLSTPEARIVAVLHDTGLHPAILHDDSACPTLARDLRAFVPQRLLRAVAAFGYVHDGLDGVSAQIMAADPIARDVELACLADLNDPGRLAELDPFTRRRLQESCAAADRALGRDCPTAVPAPSPGRPRGDGAGAARY